MPLRRNRRSVAIGAKSNPIFAVLPLTDSQSPFWSLRPYTEKTFLAFPFSPATATELRNGETATAERQRNAWWKQGIS